MKEQIVQKFGSVASFARAVGLEYLEAQRMIKNATEDKRVARKVSGLMVIGQKEENINRQILKQHFINNVRTYSKLLELVRKDLPHIKEGRLRHYLNDSSHEVNKKCPTFQAIYKAVKTAK